MSLSYEQAAQALGMKRREIIAVDRIDGGYAVTTHDGQRTLVDRNGRVVTAGDDATSPPAPPAGPDGSGTPPRSEVPEGNAADVLAWVDGDVDRARAAAAAEQAKERPRSGLLAELDKLIKAAGPADS